MTRDPADGQPPSKAAARRPSAAGLSRSRLDEIFGDVLPDTTRDDRVDGTEPDAADGGSRGVQTSADARRDEELRRDVPPHHR